MIIKELRTSKLIMKIKKIIIKSYIYLLSFLLPASVLVFSLFCDGIHPGSEKTILIYDLGGQIVSFLSYFRHIGYGFNNIMYQTLSGMGGGYFGTWAYYTSNPINFLFMFVSDKSIPDAVYFLIVSKVSLCGLSMLLFLKHGHLKIKNDLICLAFSCSYALMTYNIMYMILPMWMDAVIMLPIVIWGADRIFENKGCTFFIISFAVSVVLNYYISYMTALFVIVYFLYRSFSEEEYSKKAFKLFKSFLFSGLLSILLSCWILVPVLFDYARGKVSEGVQISSIFFRNIFDVLRQFLPLSYNGYLPSDAPKLYCGIIPILFLFVFFFSKNYSVKNKLAVLFVCLIYLFSFVVSYLDIVWQCFKVPTSFPSRYSFAFVFFVLMITAGSADCILDKYKFKKSVFETSIKTILFAAVLFDLTFNSVFTFKCIDADESTGSFLKASLYHELCDRNDLIRSYIDDDNSLIWSDYYYTVNDGLLLGNPSIEYFSSSYNKGTSSFLGSLGFNSLDHLIYDDGINTASAALLGVSYFAEYRGGLIGTELEGHLDELYSDSVFKLSKLESSVNGGAILRCNSAEEFSYDVFDNINKVYYDLSGHGDVFDKCKTELVESGIDADSHFYSVYTVYPEAGRHLYFYVSPEDYIENKVDCFDELYLGDNLIASYVDMCQRYIVDLGYSDGSPLTFRYLTDSQNNEVFFYTFDSDKFDESFEDIKPLFTKLEYEAGGISGKISSPDGGDAILLLPYEKGYTVKIDGKKTSYSDYRNALIKIQVEAGEHDIEISYITPGLVTGIMISVIGLILLGFYTYFVNKSKKNQK